MPEWKEQDLLALHFHRSLDGSWYAVVNFRDKTIGKKGQKIIANELSFQKVQEILALTKKE